MGAYTSSVGEALSVLVVDDDPFTSSLLATGLSSLGWTVMGPASDAAGALALVDAANPPTAAVLDLDLGPGPDGIDLADALRERSPHVGVVLLTAYRTPRLYRPARYRVPLGLRVVSKADVRSLQHIDAELRAAIAAPHVVNPDVLAPAVTAEGVVLTDRQVQIMQLVADGMSNAAIAQRLDIAEASVEKAIARLIRRLGLAGEAAVNPRVVLARAYEDIARPRPR